MPISYPFTDLVPVMLPRQFVEEIIINSSDGSEYSNETSVGESFTETITSSLYTLETTKQFGAALLNALSSAPSPVASTPAPLARTISESALMLTETIKVSIPTGLIVKAMCEITTDEIEHLGLAQAVIGSLGETLTDGVDGYRWAEVLGRNIVSVYDEIMAQASKRAEREGARYAVSLYNRMRGATNTSPVASTPAPSFSDNMFDLTSVKVNRSTGDERWVFPMSRDQLIDAIDTVMNTTNIQNQEFDAGIYAKAIADELLYTLTDGDFTNLKHTNLGWAIISMYCVAIEELIAVKQVTKTEITLKK